MHYTNLKFYWIRYFDELAKWRIEHCFKLFSCSNAINKSFCSFQAARCSVGNMNACFLEATESVLDCVGNMMQNN